MPLAPARPVDPPRARRRVPRSVRATAAALLALVLTGIAAPATAATQPGPCAGTYFADSGREVFDVDQRLVPPPVRGFPWDCASRIGGRDFPAPDGWAIYDLVYRDVSFDTVVGILRSFEDQGWIEGGAVAAVDSTDGQALTADELARITPEPSSVRARFGNAATGEHIVELSYFDGDQYVFDQSLTTPTLLLELSIRDGFEATGIGDPSVLSDLRRMGDVHLTAAGGAVLGGSAVVLMLVVGYPSALLDSVLSPRLDTLRRRLSTLRRRRAEPSSGPSTAPRSRPWTFAAGLLATAVFAGFVDPSFGPNLLSLRLLLTNLASLLVFNLAAIALLRAVLRRIDPGAWPAITFRWGSLAFVAIAVGIARLLEFSPGVILGLVAGLTFAATLSLAREALVVLLGSGIALALGLAAWALYSIAAPFAAGVPDVPALTFASELLSALTIEGISTLPLALLPLLALDGAALFAWKKWAWALSYAVGLAAFLLVMVTVPDSWDNVGGDYLRWVAVFARFAAVAVGAWAAHVALERRKAPSAGAAVSGTVAVEVLPQSVGQPQ